MFLNVSGGSFFPDTLSPRCLKLFLDSDPGYNQIILSERPSWSENVERWCAGVHAHDRHFTYAENFGAPDCTVKSSISLFRKNPVPGATTPAPKKPWIGYVTATALPSPSTTEWASNRTIQRLRNSACA